MINLSEVGAHIDTSGGLTVRFGIYLPNITAAKGYAVVVRIIHQKDQFTIEIPSKNFLLTFDETSPLGLWSATIDLVAHIDGNFGTPGKYLYRYMLLQQEAGTLSNPMTVPITDPLTLQQHDLTANLVTLYIPDPFATDTGIGKLSAFTVSNAPLPAFTWTDDNFKMPALDDLVVYELQVEEFSSTFDGVSQRLDYLLGLGVNMLELMPITTVPQIFDWGYGPLHFFAPEDRWGGLDGLQRLVDNFSDTDQTISVPFPKAGIYREMINDEARGPHHLDITVAQDGAIVPLPQPVPSNYGYIFVSL